MLPLFFPTEGTSYKLRSWKLPHRTRRRKSLDTAGPDGGQCHVDSAAAAPKAQGLRVTIIIKQFTLSSCFVMRGENPGKEKKGGKKGKTEKTSHSHYYVSLGETRLALATFAFIAFNPFFLVFFLLCSMFS